MILFWKLTANFTSLLAGCLWPRNLRSVPDVSRHAGLELVLWASRACPQGQAEGA